MNIADRVAATSRKLTWTWNPGSGKEAGDAVVRNLLLHWFPNKVSASSLSWRYSLWLGTISFVLFLILTVTGLILMFLYVPSVERAYGSVKDLEYVVSYGWLLRSVHRIAAHLMVAVVFLHMVRVFLTGAYKNGSAQGARRPLNWIVGLALLLLTLLLSFTDFDIYALADIAFVGGGFHAAGLHSVLEPAAFGAPVVFGPRYEASRDAALLVQRGGGASASTESELTRRLRFWVTDTASRREAGDYARALVRSGVGAAERSYELVERLLR